MNELLPCPFCGGEVELCLAPSFGSDNPEEYYSIHCDCPMGSPDANYSSNAKADIIRDWNTRAPRKDS